MKWLRELFALPTHCRVCAVTLAKPGGVGLAFVGCGFCPACATTILKAK